MKVKAISRPEDFARENTGDIWKISRNYDNVQHPFERQREYTRALNTTKLERMFAKPFVASMEGHQDGIYTMAKVGLTQLVSGSGDGEIRLWNLTTQKTVWSIKPYRTFVQGLTFLPYNPDRFISVGEKQINIWDSKERVQMTSYLSNQVFTAVDHHRHDHKFATSSSAIEIWDHGRSEPISSMEWGSETINTVKFNQTETSVLVSCGSDRSVILYDIRTSSPLSKLVMNLKTNAIAWNPMEAFNFTTASEDHNCYTFDMRYLKHSLSVAKGHVSAVMDIDYSPTGQEFVTASYDKTIRIFEARQGIEKLINQGGSRDIYHTKRMQKAFSVKFSMDSKYIMSASDDGNIRLWKANASEKLGTLSNRELSTGEYQSALKERYKSMPEISRIDKHRRLPRAITKATHKKSVMIGSIKQKEDNRRKHSKAGAVPFVAERKKHILTTEQ